MPNKLTNETFVEKAKKVHKDKYNYDKVNYLDSRVKVIINCPIHGDFYQRASHHLSGHGCISCGDSEQSNTEDFIEKAKVIYGGKIRLLQV